MRRRHEYLLVLTALTALAVPLLARPPVVAAAGASGWPMCRASQMTLAAESNSGLGHGGYTLRLTNRTRSTCSLQGYAQVTGVTAHGNTAGAVRSRVGYIGGVENSNPTLPVVDVGYRESASFAVEDLDFRANGTSDCPLFMTLKVALPGSSATVTVSVSLLACGVLYVHPIVAGPTGFMQ